MSVCVCVSEDSSRESFSGQEVSIVANFVTIGGRIGVWIGVWIGLWGGSRIEYEGFGDGLGYGKVVGEGIKDLGMGQ